MPWIDLQGAVNVRDLGGLPTDDGGQTVVGRLLRADNLQELSASDVSRLVQDIGLTTVVDLRSSAELASEGPAPLDAVPGVRHVHHPVVPEIGLATDVVAEALLLKKMQDQSRFPSDPTCGHYLGYLEDRPDEVVGAVRSIAQRPGRGAGPLRGRQGPDRRGGRAGADRGRRPPAGRGGRLRGDGGAHRGHHQPPAPVTDVHPGHRQRARRSPPAPAGNDGRLPRSRWSPVTAGSPGG